MLKYRIIYLLARNSEGKNSTRFERSDKLDDNDNNTTIKNELPLKGEKINVYLNRKKQGRSMQFCNKKNKIKRE